MTENKIREWQCCAKLFHGILRHECGEVHVSIVKNIIMLVYTCDCEPLLHVCIQIDKACFIMNTSWSMVGQV